MNTYTLLKPLAFSLHYAISQSKLVTKLYIKLLSFLLKPIPHYGIKKRIVNSINMLKWPKVELEPQQVKVGSSTAIKLIPHFQEFDLESVVSTTLGYESEVFSYLEQHMADYDAVIEIGANVGVFSIFFSQCFRHYNKPGANIFVFEPSREAYLRLLKNIEINEASNIQAFNCAIGSEVDFLNFFEPEGHLTNGSLSSHFAEIFSKSISTTKALVISGHLLEKLVESSENILLKIDVEGAEFEVLTSLEELIKNKKPTLLIEVLPDYQDKLNQLNFLFSENYSFFNITDAGLVKHEKFEASQFRDYVLLPPNKQQ